MILGDRAIRRAMLSGEIVIEPFDDAMLGGNSYDVRLGSVLRVYDCAGTWTTLHGFDLRYLLDSDPAARSRELASEIDSAVEMSTIDIQIDGDGGILLVPGVLYLASTLEYTETHVHVPYLDGKSGVGRLGIFIHATAGRGDVGFCGHWTMEISVVQPVRVYAGMPIGQLTYHTVLGEVDRQYQSKVGGSYRDGRDPKPQPSRLWKKLQAKP